MGTFNKLKKNRKSSHLNEKIEFLNQELEKTGVISETPANSTAGIYNTIEFTPGLPSVTSDVPDSTGFSDGSSTQDANGGDESDSDTWENGWNNISDMQNSNNLNGETNRNIPFTPDLSGWIATQSSNRSSSNPIGSGFGGVAIWSISSGIGGGKTIGTITAGNTYVGMVVPSNIFSTYNYPGYPRTNRVYAWYSDSEYAAAKNIADAYEDNKTKLWVTRKVWVPYDMATSHGGPSYAEYTGAKKTTTITNYEGNSETKMWKLKEISVLAGTRQNYISQNSTPDVRTTMFRTGLDDGEYYPGPTSGFMDFLRGVLNLSNEALELLMGAGGDNNIAGGLPYGTPGADDPFDHDDLDDDDLLDDSDFDMSDWEFAFAEIEDDMENDSSSDSSPFDEPASDANTGWVNPGDEVAWGGGKSKEEKALEKKFNYWNNTAKYNNKQKGDNAAAMIQMGMGIPVDSFTQTFGITPTEWQNPANWLPDGKPNPNGAAWNKYKNEKYEPQGELIKEGWESPKHTYVDKNQQKRWFKEKDVAPVYPKKAPPKLVRGYHPDMLPKLDTPIPQIKVNAKDLVRSHKLTKVEAQEWVDKIERLNDYIARNPDRLAYARERYPASDPHLAALNYKLDMQLAAADEYIEKQFPENIRLYNKVLAATKKSIKLTDPKTFKSENGVFTTFNKLARVQHVDNVYQPKERTLKLKKRGKNSVNRFLSKPKEKTKDDILKDKLAVLDKEMQKTMPDKV